MIFNIAYHDIVLGIPHIVGDQCHFFVNIFFEEEGGCRSTVNLELDAFPGLLSHARTVSPMSIYYFTLS